jgi:hypothetical protein
MMIKVNIPNACKLSETALVGPSVELMEKKGVFLTPGIVQSVGEYCEFFWK